MKSRVIFAVTLLCCVVAAVVYSVRREGQHAFTFAATPIAVTPVVAQADSAPPPAEASMEWPQWRGPNRDGVSSATGLLSEWPEEGPPLAWTGKGLGRGMAGVSVANGRIYTMGKRAGQGVCMIALNVENGEEVWATPIDSDDDPTGTPTVDGDRVYAVTYNGVLACAEAATGRVVWKKSFVDDFGSEVPRWGFSESPLIDGDVVVCTPGADDALIVALDKATGETKWATKLPQELKKRGHGGAGYASIVIGEGAGVRQYVQLFGNGVIGVATADGTPLWGYDRIANGTANIPTPIVRGDYVFVSTGYGAGTALLKLERTAEGVKSSEVYFHSGKEMQNHHGGMVLVGDHVYFGNGHNQGLPICVEFLTGKVAWGPVRGPGSDSAAVLYADGNLYFRYQNAVMALIEATPEGYHLKSSFELPSHLDNSWPHPVIADGRLYLRDQDVLMCYDVRGK